MSKNAKCNSLTSLFKTAVYCKNSIIICVITCFLILCGCNDNSGRSLIPIPLGSDDNGYTIGGTVTGLSGTMELQLSSDYEDEPVIKNIDSDGPFQFKKEIPGGSNFSIMVKSQPAGMICTASGNTGIVISNIDDVKVTCSVKTHTIGGTVNGLRGTLVLQNNHGDDLTLNSDDPFIFNTPVAHSADYMVTVKTQPEGSLFCSVYNGTGTALDDVNHVVVACGLETCTISGTVTNLIGDLLLECQGEEQIISSNGPFTCNAPVLRGMPYYVSADAVSDALNCTVANGSGTVHGDVTDVAVSCEIIYDQLFVDTGATIIGLYKGSSSFGDVDGDGDLDLFITGLDASENPVAKLYRNEGNASFTEISSPVTGVENGDSSFGDVDGDNDLDLIVVGQDSSSSPTAKLYRNDGSGGFTEDSGAGLGGVYFTCSTSFGDLDNDGDQDLVITGWDASLWSWTKRYVNDGSGNFTLAETPVQNGDYYSTVGDMDSDGDIDLIIIGNNLSTSQREIRLYYNDGAGNFTVAGTPVSIDQLGPPVVIGDIDTDGDKDLAVNGKREHDGFGKTQLYRNDGDGNFTNSGTDFSEIEYSSIASGDADSDGDLDLVINGKISTNIVSKLYLNDGSGNFSDSGVSLDGVYHGLSSFGDINNDNNMDLIIMGKNSSDIPIAKVYKNRLPEVDTGASGLGGSILSIVKNKPVLIVFVMSAILLAMGAIVAINIYRKKTR